MRYVVFVLLFGALLNACGGGGSGGSSGSPAAASPSASAPAASPAVVASPTLVVPADDRVRIPKLGIDAPLTKKLVPLAPNQTDPSNCGNLADANTPDDVVLYDWSECARFGGTPGKGNAMLFARVDSGSVACKNGTVPPPCAGVFFTLNNVAVGDDIQVFVDRQAFVYKVVARCSVLVTDFKKADWIYKTSAAPIATLLTAGGTFDREKRAYSHYTVIRAELEKGTLESTCPSDSEALPPPRTPAAAAPQTAPTAAPTRAPAPAMTLTYDRQQEPGSIASAPPGLIPHRFKVTGLPANTPIPTLGPNIHVTPKLPPRTDSLPWDVAAIRFDAGDLVIFVPPSTPAGTYEISIDLPDGRKAQSSFTHKP